MNIVSKGNRNLVHHLFSDRPGGSEILMDVKEFYTQEIIQVKLQQTTVGIT